MLLTSEHNVGLIVYGNKVIAPVLRVRSTFVSDLQEW